MWTSSSSLSSSTTPLTVTCCAVFQFSGVKVSDAGEKVTASGSGLVDSMAGVMVTSADGLVSSTTV